MSEVIIFLLGKRITKTPIQNFYKIYLLLSLVARISRKCYPSKLRSHYFLSSRSSFSSWFLIGTSNGGWVTSGVRNEPSINFSLGSTYSFSNCLYFLKTLCRCQEWTAISYMVFQDLFTQAENFCNVFQSALLEHLLLDQL